jgi:carbonic anhydrase
MLTFHTVETAEDPAIEHIRYFFRRYVARLGDEALSHAVGREVADLPGDYAPPGGRLILAAREGQPLGYVGLRPLAEGVCELRRLYVAPEARGQGLGMQLAFAAIRAAREIGYRRVQLDSLPYMRMAVKLYRELGFTDTPAYYPSPVEGTLFMSLDLDNWSEEGVRNENLSHLFDFNRAWASQTEAIDPGYFQKLAHLQNPEYLWIGCSDSRVPANQIVGLLPGEVFVHRNVANVVAHSDLNCLSVIQFAVDVLKVKHIMVVGHYGCSGVKAVLRQDRVGLVDIWLRHVQDVRQKHRMVVEDSPEATRQDRLCELNALEQAANVCQTCVVQDAWARGQPLTIHSWIYGLKDGLVRDLGMTVNAPEDLPPRYTAALDAIRESARC